MVAFETMVIEYIRIKAEKWIRWGNIVTIHNDVNRSKAKIAKKMEAGLIGPSGFPP